MNVQLVTVKTYMLDYEAELDHSLLSDAGIESYLAYQNLSNMYVGYAMAMGGILLQVKQEDVEQAASILNLQQSDTTLEQQTIICPKTISCPNCNSENTKPLSPFHPTNWKKLTMLVFGVLTCTGVKYHHEHWKCHQCHQQFEKNQ